MNEESYSQGIVQCVTLNDLTRMFNLAELIEMTRSGLLQAWLNENVSEESADILSLDEIFSWDDDELRLMLCEVLSININELSDYDTQSIERALNKRWLKKIFGNETGTIVTNQHELKNALNAGDVDIYLVGGVFQIPLNKGGVTYHGCNNAVVEIPNLRDVDFDRAEIFLNDLQVFVRHSITVRYSGSTNLIFLRGDKIAINEAVKKIDVYKLLCGRQTFETPEEFSRRAESMTGIVVGKVIFDGKNYDINCQRFRLKIDWYSDFLSIARRWAGGKFFGCNVPVEFAKKIYETERVQLVYADFCADGDLPAIKRLYLITSEGTRIDILISDYPNFEDLIRQLQSGTSGGEGYGLELVKNFTAELKKFSR